MHRLIVGSKIFLMLVLLLSGCRSSLPYMDWQYDPELSHDVGDQGHSSQPNPVVVIPGIVGSSLSAVDTGKEYWSGGRGEGRQADPAG